jgi:hypothetical protein
MSRIHRTRNRIASRSYDYQGLRTAVTVGQSVSWARRFPIEMFNKNVLRAKVVQGIVETMPCNSFFETGTYHAATTIGAQRYFNLPVWSCEVNLRNYLISRAVTLNMPNIVLVKDDSRNFLRKVCLDIKTNSASTPFFYLDAHENELDPSSLPLEEEIQIILTLDEFAVMIDDFQVPFMDSFEARRYAGVIIEIELIKRFLMLKGIEICYFPAYASSQDTGYPSGFCVFWRSARLNSMLQNHSFPMNLIRPYSLAKGAYLGSNPEL